jgi:hypothetical protein
MLLNASQSKGFIRAGFALLISFFVSFPLASQTQANIVIEKHSNYGVIKGVVRDQQGNPIKDAIVAVFHLGTSKVLKQVRSSSNGSFWARIIPGRYTILAVAEGFNAETVQEVSVNRATELNYGFKLERAGSGNTLPEKSVDKPSTKIKVRRAYQSRSIYQNKEGKTPIDENASAENEAVEETITAVEDVEDEKKRRSQSVFETYFAGSDEGSFTGFNFATIQPLGQNTEIVIAGQTGSKSFAPNRIETTIKHRPNSKHQIRLTASAAKLGKVNRQELGQISFQALDEWNLKNGVILVLGFDASKFVGAGNDFSISPRLGAQFEIDAKTRVKTAFTTQTEERTWSQAVELENSQVLFREQFAPQVIAVKEDKPLMNKSRRLEFGVERILDNSSSVEATAFLDTVTGRGVGLVNLPFNALDAENLTPFTVEQHGKTQGGRVVYARRFNGIFSTQAGYAFGAGQKISSDAIDNPANIFENGFFQTFVGQVNADLGTGTRVQTIFRLSPQATVFAIDPFQGRLAIYDPGLSILVTHPLPNLGLPFRATAIIDARNLLDFQTGVSGEEGSLRLNSQQRILRGGISVRF